MATGSEILLLFLICLLGSPIQTLTNKVRKGVVDKFSLTKNNIEAQKLTELGPAGQGCPGEATATRPVLAWASVAGVAGAGPRLRALFSVFTDKVQVSSASVLQTQISRFDLTAQRSKSSLYALVQSHPGWSKQPFRNCNGILCLTFSYSLQNV